MTTLTVSIVVHGDFSHIRQALDSLYANTQMQVRVHLIVNSGASDDVETIRSAYPSVEIHTNDYPRGFATNHNLILKNAETPYTALLNDDVYIHPRALDLMVEHLEQDSDIGLVGAHIINPDGTPQISVFSDPTVLRMLYAISGLGKLTAQGSRIRRYLQRMGVTRFLGAESLNTSQVTRSVPVVVGVAMLARRSAYLESGLMDEDTRFYAEEFGWHWRLRKHGWKIVHVAESCITHFNTGQDLTGWKMAEHRKGILNYFIRYRPSWQALIIRCSIVLSHGLAGLLFLPFSASRARDNLAAVKVGMFWYPLD